MKKVLFHEGFKINSIQDLVPGHLNVLVVNAYDVEDLPHDCYIGDKRFSSSSFMAMVNGLLDAGKKIPAIILVRGCNAGWNLMESKEFVESL